jgi:quercetin dioxygenase-like cupin family protein
VARRGEVLESPINGQRAVFRETAEDTGGELLRLDFFVAPGGFLGSEHLHPKQEERIKVLSGTLRCRIGGRERSVGAGEAIDIPPGVAHTLWNESQEEAHALVEYRPALRMETLFETLFGLGRNGKTDEEGTPRLLQGAVMLEEYEDEYRLARPPLPMQKALLALLAPVGRLLGYQTWYARYSGPARPAYLLRRSPQQEVGSAPSPDSGVKKGRAL